MANQHFCTFYVWQEVKPLGKWQFVPGCLWVQETKQVNCLRLNEDLNSCSFCPPWMPAAASTSVKAVSQILLNLKKLVKISTLTQSKHIIATKKLVVLSSAFSNLFTTWHNLKKHYMNLKQLSYLQKRIRPMYCSTLSRGRDSLATEVWVGNAMQRARSASAVTVKESVKSVNVDKYYLLLFLCIFAGPLESLHACYFSLVWRSCHPDRTGLKCCCADKHCTGSSICDKPIKSVNKYHDKPIKIH